MGCSNVGTLGGPGVVIVSFLVGFFSQLVTFLVTLC